MREIKFRAWDSISQSLHPWNKVELVALCEFVDLEHYTLMQYTGLKDKNGVEIYEGDVVRSETYRVRISDNAKVKGSECTNDYIIEWSTKPFVDGWQLRKIDTSVRSKFGIGQISNTSLHVYIKSCEVIGNIHENPELLK